MIVACQCRIKKTSCWYFSVCVCVYGAPESVIVGLEWMGGWKMGVFVVLRPLRKVCSS